MEKDAGIVVQFRFWKKRHHQVLTTRLSRGCCEKLYTSIISRKVVGI
jgi:hypothetical protein